MSNIKSKLKYFLRSVQKRASKFTTICPSCGSLVRSLVDSKFVVTQLVECDECHLLYRIPGDSPIESDQFYQYEYEQGPTTKLPSEKELQSLIASNFSALPNSYRPYLGIFEALQLKKGTRVLDYGCSWGYGSYQLRKAGMEVEGFELSRARARYAVEKLKLEVRSDLDDLSNDFDVFFSSHVLEHVANLDQTFSFARRLTKAGGIFLSLTPNGSPDFRRANPDAFHRLWGLAHPNLLQARFVQKAFHDKPLFLGSNPYPLEGIALWDRSRSVHTDLSGWEMVIIAIL